MSNAKKLFASVNGGFIYLQYNACDIVQTESPKFRSVSGYGMKIPTDKKLRHEGRLYRVYVAQFSNAGSAYIIKRGKRYLITEACQ